MLRRMQGVYFDWSIWRSGTLLDLGSITRTQSIMDNRAALRRYAVGWCPGGSALTRPKPNAVAVMFEKGDIRFWTHISIEEFDILFKEED